MPATQLKTFIINTMNPSENIVVLKKLAGNSPAGELTNSQQFLLPHLELLETIWTGLFFLTFSIVVFRYIIKPLFLDKKSPL